jgi:hypothetical protein
MKWLRTLVVINRGNVVSSDDWKAVHNSYVRSIQSIDFPKGSGSLTLRRKVKRPDGKWRRNGVGYLRSQFLNHMVNVEAWRSEIGFDLSKGRTPPELRLYPSMELHHEPIKSDFGEFDFVTTAPAGARVAIEWETGNISSSHRSMNKLAIALVAGKIEVGVLIVPARALYEHLTDRIGNIDELSGYLTMWKDLETRVERGLLAISVVQHDALTDDPKFPFLRVGKDGRALEGRTKKRRARKIKSKKR